jgi:hypothetical protein
LFFFRLRSVFEISVYVIPVLGESSQVKLMEGSPFTEPVFFLMLAFENRYTRDRRHVFTVFMMVTNKKLNSKGVEKARGIREISPSKRLSSAFNSWEIGEESSFQGQNDRA